MRDEIKINNTFGHSLIVVKESTVVRILSHHLKQSGFSVQREVPILTGYPRRIDIVAVGKNGAKIAIEVKVRDVASAIFQVAGVKHLFDEVGVAYWYKYAPPPDLVRFASEHGITVFEVNHKWVRLITRS